MATEPGAVPPEFLREQGNQLVRARKYAEACTAYSRALELIALAGSAPAGDDATALRLALLANRALCHLELRALPEAVADCDAVLAVQPQHAKARFRRGLAREQLLRFDEAVADLEAAADALPAINGDVQTALRRIRKQRQRAPTARAELLGREALREASAGDHPRAVELLTEALALEPHDASLYEARAHSCSALGKYNAVLHDAERMVELRPELAAGHALAGMALYCMHEFEQATHAYTRATQLEPADARLAAARADAAKKLGASLRQAAMAGDLALLRRYTRNRIADLDVRDDNGFSPLTLAVVGGHADAAQLLLDAGLAVDARDRFGKTALHWAASRGHAPLGALLLGASADPAARDSGGWDVLMAAAHAGCYALVEQLLAAISAVAGGGAGGGPSGESAARAALRARPREDVPSALMCAAQNGHAHVVKLLLAAGADASQQLLPKGLTALDFATQGSHAGATALLQPLTPATDSEQGL
jgi:tetratricopeptide (TPR) repeat protein